MYLFGLFEALRSGDTAAISKAMRQHASATLGLEGKETSPSAPASARLEGTTILRLAIQCAGLPVIDCRFLNAMSGMDVNGQDRDGNTPLHVAAMLGRASVVGMLLDLPRIDDSVINYRSQTSLELARTLEIFQQLQLARSLLMTLMLGRYMLCLLRATMRGWRISCQIRVLS